MGAPDQPKSDASNPIDLPTPSPQSGQVPTPQHQQPPPPLSPSPSAPPSVPTPPPGREHAPPLGTRIQVLWRIEPPTPSPPSSPSQTTPTVSSPETVERWWGATVQDCMREVIGSTISSAHPDAQVHMLLYDAYGEFGEDVARAAFLPDNVLVDLSRVDDEGGGRLDWRVEEAEAEVDRGGGVEELTLRQFVDEQEMLVEEAGVSRDADLQALSEMPANVQMHMVEGYRRFADVVKGMLEELVQSKPRGYAVTAADVQKIHERVLALKAGEGGGMGGV